MSGLFFTTRLYIIQNINDQKPFFFLFDISIIINIIIIIIIIIHHPPVVLYQVDDVEHGGGHPTSPLIVELLESLTRFTAIKYNFTKFDFEVGIYEISSFVNKIIDLRSDG